MSPPCYEVSVPGVGFAIACARGPRRKSKPCSVCQKRTGTRLCDGKVGAGKTCDAPLCDACTFQVAPPHQKTLIGPTQSPADPRDYCPKHRPAEARHG